MRITLYPIFCAVCILFYSCDKTEQITDPAFGSINFSSVAPQAIRIVPVNSSVIKNTAGGYSVVSGKTAFRFYIGDLLLLDTALSAEAFQTHNYVLIKPDDKSSLIIADAVTTGLENEKAPDAGSVKFSFVNFSTKLPSKVDVTIVTDTYVANVARPIQIGSFDNVTSSFSAYQALRLGINQIGRFTNTLSVIVKDPATQTILSTATLTLPLVLTGIDADKLESTVYVISLQDNPAVSILLSK
jgi:hypothetical protein